MSLIFDKFPDRAHAEKFAADFGGKVYDTEDASYADDPYPFRLHPPIVQIPRVVNANDDIDFEAEEPIERAVRKKKYGGEFAGT